MRYDDIISGLNTVDEAIDNEDLKNIDENLAYLDELYSGVKPTERTRMARLQVAKNESDLTNEELEPLSEYERWYLTTVFARGGFLTASELYLIDPIEIDSNELSDMVSDLISREMGLKNATHKANSILQGIELPSQIDILSFSTTESPLFGKFITAKIDVKNIGDDTATGITAKLKSKTLGVEQSVTIDSLDPNDSHTTTFELEASTEGTANLTAVVETENAGSLTETDTVTVRTEKSVVNTSLETIISLEGLVKEELGQKGAKRSIVSKLNAASQSLNRALTAIERGQNKQASNAIKTAMNQLESLLNSVNKNRRDQITESSFPHRKVVNHINIILEHLADVKSIK